MSGHNPIYSHMSIPRTSGVDSSAAGLQPHRAAPQSSTLSRAAPASTSETSRPTKKRRLNKKEDDLINIQSTATASSMSMLVMNPVKRASKKRQLSAEADTKRERRYAVDAKVDQGWDLLKGIDAKGDRLRIWFKRLGLPCHPERVAKVKRSKPPLEASEQPMVRSLRASRNFFSSEDVADSDSNSGSGPTVRDEGDAASRIVDKKYATASTVTPEQMQNYLRWEFLKPEKDPKFRIKNPGTTYDAYYQYNEAERRAIHDITVPVQHKADEGTPDHLALDRKITQHLREEQHRMFAEQSPAIQHGLPDQEYLERQPKLYIPTNWEASAFIQEELDKGEPQYFAMPESHAGFIPKPTYKGLLRTAKSMPADMQSSGSTHSGGIRAPLPPPPEIVQYVHSAILDISESQETLEWNMLLFKYWFNEDDPLETKEAMASGLDADRRVLNRPWERWRAIEAMSNRMKVVSGLKEVVKMLQPNHMKQNDDTFGNGNTTLNCEAEDLLLFEPFIIEKFLAFPGCAGEMASEGPVEKIVGNLLKGIVAGSDFIDRDNSPLPFPRHLKVVGTNPSPDIYVRASPGEDWLPTLLPVLFAGECKPIIHYDIWMPRAQLACAFHATLVIFILYYLDTRHSTDSALPPWLFLYGIEYTELGVRIHAHHPAYRVDKLTGAGHWIFKATTIVDEYENAFKQGGDYILQIQLLAALFRVRSHSIHVLERLKQWKRGPKILEILTSGSKKEVTNVRAWVENRIQTKRPRTRPAGATAT